MSSTSLTENTLPEVFSLAQLGIDSEALFTEMETLVVTVELKTDPDSYYIGEKLAAVREATRRAQTLYIRIQKASSAADNKLVELETNYDILLNSSLENDADVLAGQSSGERTAIAGNKLISYKRLIKQAKSTVRTLVSLEKALNLCLRNLKSTNDDIKSQSKLMEALLHNLKTSDMSKGRENPLLKETMSDLDQFDRLADQMLEQQGSDDTVEIGVQGTESLRPQPDEPEGGVDSEDLADEATEELVDPVLEEVSDDTLSEFADLEEVAPESKLAPLESSEDDFEIDPGLTGAPISIPAQEVIALDAEDPQEEVIAVEEVVEAPKPAFRAEADEAFETEPAVDDDDIMGMLMSDEEEPSAVESITLDGLDGLDALVGSSMETAAKDPKPFKNETPAVEAPKAEAVVKKEEESLGTVDDLLSELGLL